MRENLFSRTLETVSDVVTDWKPLVMTLDTVEGDDEGMSGSRTRRHTPS